MKLKKRRDLIVKGNFYKINLFIALPLMVSTLIQRAYTLTDMYFLGRIGSNEVAALTSVFIGILSLLSSTKILELLRLNGDLLKLGSSYLKIVLLGTIFTFINTCYIFIKQVEGDSMRHLYMNIFLNPILIFNMNLGIIGAAMTTITGQNLRNNNPGRVKEAVKKMTILFVILGVIGTFVIFCFSEEIVRTFSSDTEVIVITKEFLRIIVPKVFMWGIY